MIQPPWPLVPNPSMVPCSGESPQAVTGQPLPLRSPMRYVPTALAVTEGRVEVELFGTWIGATVSVGALFDRKGDRI
jgi:hypothetical protein